MPIWFWSISSTPASPTAMSRHAGDSRRPNTGGRRRSRPREAQCLSRRQRPAVSRQPLKATEPEPMIAVYWETGIAVSAHFPFFILGWRVATVKRMFRWPLMPA